jgi:hypothetical protein
MNHVRDQEMMSALKVSVVTFFIVEQTKRQSEVGNSFREDFQLLIPHFLSYWTPSSRDRSNAILKSIHLGII